MKIRFTMAAAIGMTAVMFSLPPTNHCACGDFQRSTSSHGRIHSSSLANDSQKASGLAAARS